MLAVVVDDDDDDVAVVVIADVVVIVVVVLVVVLVVVVIVVVLVFSNCRIFRVRHESVSSINFCTHFVIRSTSEKVNCALCLECAHKLADNF